VPILALAAMAVAGAYLVAVFGPKPAPATLAPAQAAQLAQAASSASVSGVLTWRGEFTPDGAAIVYDARGVPHFVIG